MSMIPLSGAEIVDFVPTYFKLNEREEGQPTFYFRVPTFAMRDKMAALLMQRGLLPPTLTQARGILIDALYDLYEEAEADEHAAFLEGYWTRSQVHDELVQGWQIREAERLFDIAQGVRKDLPQEPLPPAPFTMREQARQASVVTHVIENNDRFRVYQARFMAQEEEEEEMLLRLFIHDWKNCGGVVCARDKLDRIELESIEALRRWLADEGARTAWDEVKMACKSHHGVPGGLEKNSESPLDTNSSQTGSPTSSGDLATKDGNLTTSSTTPIPASESLPPTAVSRNSRSGRGGKRAKASGAKRRGRTGAPS